MLQYPATMLTTSDHDDRVPPLHSLKFVAELQFQAKSHPNQVSKVWSRYLTEHFFGCSFLVLINFENEAEIFI